MCSVIGVGNRPKYNADFQQCEQQMVHKQVAMHKVIDTAGTKSMDMREVKLSKLDLCYTLMAFAGACCLFILIVTVTTIRIPVQLKVKVQAGKNGEI